MRQYIFYFFVNLNVFLKSIFHPFLYRINAKFIQLVETKDADGHTTTEAAKEIMKRLPTLYNYLFFKYNFCTDRFIEFVIVIDLTFFFTFFCRPDALDKIHHFLNGREIPPESKNINDVKGLIEKYPPIDV